MSSNSGPTAYRSISVAIIALLLAACSTISPYLPDFGGTPAPIRTSANAGPKADAIIKTARTQIGKRYKWGGESPNQGYDCSGLIWWVYRRHGISVPRVSWQQYSAGTFVEKNDIRPGDLIFFKVRTGKSMHVGIVTDRGTFIHAPRSGKHVMESSLANDFWREHYVGSRRVIR